VKPQTPYAATLPGRDNGGCTLFANSSSFTGRELQREISAHVQAYVLSIVSIARRIEQGVAA
jgi:hypothetical protein